MLFTAVELLRVNRSAKWSTERIRAEQLRRFAVVLENSRRAPFWEEHLRGVEPPATFDDLIAVPTVGKGDLRDLADEQRLTASVSESRRIVRTSGSTGEPFSVPYAWWGAWYQGVLVLRARAAQGMHPWNRRVSVDVYRDEPGVRGFTGLRGDHVVHLTPDVDVRDAARQLVAEKPQVLSGAGHLLIELLEQIDEGSVRPKAVVTNGETMTPERRAALAEGFGVGPIDNYGTSECGIVAWQCRAMDLYHVNHESVLVEILDASGDHAAPGEEGELVLTNLWNELTPFVRYRIGDSAAWATRPCRCGSQQPALEYVHGRTPDWLVDVDGRRVSPHRLWLSVHLGIDALPHVRRYCVRQDEARRVAIDIVPVDGFAAEHARALEQSYTRVLGDVGVEVRIVDAIQTIGDRKFETVMSRAGRANAPRTE